MTPLYGIFARDNLERVRHLLGAWSIVRFEEPDHYIGVAVPSALQLFERGIGFADSRCDAQIDAMPTTCASTGLAANAVQHLLGTRPLERHQLLAPKLSVKGAQRKINRAARSINAFSTALARSRLKSVPDRRLGLDDVRPELLPQ